MKTPFKILFISLFLISGISIAQIASSAHDFSSKGWSGGEICLPCHAPHHTDLTISEAPLWNHEVTVETFETYNSSTLDATIGQPAGVSKLCLSCHDGSVALDNFGGAVLGTNFVTGKKKLDSDIRNDHPISFTYDDALATADGELFPPSSTSSGITGGTTISADMLISGNMECSSCHDVHNGHGNEKLLVINNAGSALCLTCHDK